MEIESETKKEKEPETPDNTGDAGDGLDFLDEKTEEKPEPTIMVTETPAKTQPEQPTRPLPLLDETQKKIRTFNAKMYVRLLSESNLWLCEPLARMRMKREMAKVKPIDFDAMINALDDPDSTVLTTAERKKAEEIFDKWTKKMDRLPFSETEESELQQAFSDYMETTGKLVLDPGYTLALTIVGIESKRISTLLL